MTPKGASTIMRGQKNIYWGTVYKIDWPRTLIPRIFFALLAHWFPCCISWQNYILRRQSMRRWSVLGERGRCPGEAPVIPILWLNCHTNWNKKMYFSKAFDILGGYTRIIPSVILGNLREIGGTETSVNGYQRTPRDVPEGKVLNYTAEQAK